jgi:hypothetical protein
VGGNRSVAFFHELLGMGEEGCGVGVAAAVVDVVLGSLVRMVLL